MLNRLLIALMAAALSFGAYAQEKKAAEKTAGEKGQPKINAPAQKDHIAEHGAKMENQHAICIGCHGIPGYKTAYPEVYHVPKIAGQQPAYIVSALKAYRSGQRSHPSMRGVAASLTDEDMEALAAYYGAPAK
jgi:cytochrome c553